jgi:hypothetical protein
MLGPAACSACWAKRRPATSRAADWAVPLGPPFPCRVFARGKPVIEPVFWNIAFIAPAGGDNCPYCLTFFLPFQLQ